MKQTLRPCLGRQASLATRHAKEQALALPMRFELGLELAVPPDLDTDALGTFCGEVARQGTPAQVCLRKARLGMAATGLPLGVANEGSFGPHPSVPCIAAGIEMMTFVDDERGRAHHNPTRMAVIQQLAFRLARRLAKPCPACAAPGWGRTATVAGLPCELCDEPTSMTRCEVFGCVVCAYREDRPRGDRRQRAPPRYCPECNP